MQTFKTFINEQNAMDPMLIQVDSKVLENNKDAINADFDRLTIAPYQNSIIFYNQLRATLERYGMIIPPGATRHFLNFDSELAFKLGDSGLFLYVVFNTHKNTSKVEAYAQVVDAEELDSLMNSEDEEDEDEVEEAEKEEEDMEEDDMEEQGDNEEYRKRDSDAGDTSEY